MLLTYSSLFHRHIYIWPNLLYVLQPKQHIVTYWMKKQIREYSCTHLGQTLSNLIINHSLARIVFVMRPRLKEPLSDQILPASLHTVEKKHFEGRRLGQRKQIMRTHWCNFQNTWLKCKIKTLNTFHHFSNCQRFSLLLVILYQTWAETHSYIVFMGALISTNFLEDWKLQILRI